VHHERRVTHGDPEAALAGNLEGFEPNQRGARNRGSLRVDAFTSASTEAVLSSASPTIARASNAVVWPATGPVKTTLP